MTSSSIRAHTNPRARFILLGGFLGAGKTTAVAELARHFIARGLRVGLITNDQGRELVDTQTLRGQGFETAEILGGCFCCRFDSLVTAARQLAAQSRPDVIIAEPVGSCTDLLATVSYPLRRLCGGDFTLAPVSVLVDPIRALRALGVEKGGGFSAKVDYIYQKQLEEADLIVINKSDLLDAPRLESLRNALAKEFPHQEILAVSLRDGSNVTDWFARLEAGEQTGRGTMEVDYDIYADGEALMGWLNGTVRLAASQAFDADRLLEQLAGELQTRLQSRQVEIAHLKMTFCSNTSGVARVGVVNLVRSDFVPEPGMQLGQPVEEGELLINLRAEAAPELLATTVQDALAAVATAFPTMQANLTHLEYFRPGRPQPTHRDTAATGTSPSPTGGSTLENSG